MANAIWPVIHNLFQQNKLLKNMAYGMAKRNGIRIRVKNKWTEEQIEVRWAFR